MTNKSRWLAAVIPVVLVPLLSRAQDNTSRLIPFTMSTSLAPGTTQEVVVELWDAPTDGALIFNESYAGADALAVGDDGSISFLFGSLQSPPGLTPNDFPLSQRRREDQIRSPPTTPGSDNVRFIGDRLTAKFSTKDDAGGRALAKEKPSPVGVWRFATESEPNGAVEMSAQMGGSFW